MSPVFESPGSIRFFIGGSSSAKYWMLESWKQTVSTTLQNTVLFNTGHVSPFTVPGPLRALVAELALDSWLHEEVPLRREKSTRYRRQRKQCQRRSSSCAYSDSTHSPVPLCADTPTANVDAPPPLTTRTGGPSGTAWLVIHLGEKCHAAESASVRYQPKYPNTFGCKKAITD